jgi:hypothetical protein
MSLEVRRVCRNDRDCKVRLCLLHFDENSHLLLFLLRRLAEAWSAPAVSGSGTSRPLSTSVSPSSLRPISIHTGAANGSNPHLPQQQPISRSGASTPANANSSAGGGGWQHAPPPSGRYEDPYRRGGSEGNASSSSIHRIPQPQQQQQQQQQPPTSAPMHAPHPYNDRR